MTNNPLFAALGDDWRRQTIDLAPIRRRAERRRLLANLAQLTRLAAAAVALLFGYWYLREAMAEGSATFGLAGGILLFGTPLILFEYWDARQRLVAAGGDSPAEVLRQARRQAEAARHMLWGCRPAALLLAAGAAGTAGLAFAGRASRDEALLLVPTWLLTALATWLWQARKGRRLAAEIARCDALLTELGEAD